MTIPDPIRPYVDLIRLALWIALALAIAGIGFYGGLRWNADEVADAEARIAVAERALGDFATTFNEVNAQYARDRLAAERQAERAAEAVERADRRADQYRETLGGVRAEIEEAKRDPDCRAILEQTTCAVLR